MLFLCWALYLSLSSVGGVFMAFQWDILLLETALVAIVIAPSGRAAAPGAVWLGRLLLFKLMFSSGYVKLASHDPTWADLTALTYHFETQPLPTWVGWWLHQLPDGVHRFSAGVVFVIQLGAPWLLFGPGGCGPQPASSSSCCSS